MADRIADSAASRVKSAYGRLHRLSIVAADLVDGIDNASSRKSVPSTGVVCCISALDRSCGGACIAASLPGLLGIDQMAPPLSGQVPQWPDRDGDPPSASRQLPPRTSDGAGAACWHYLLSGWRVRGVAASLAGGERASLRYTVYYVRVTGSSGMTTTHVSRHVDPAMLGRSPRNLSIRNKRAGSGDYKVIGRDRGGRLITRRRGDRLSYSLASHHSNASRHERLLAERQGI